MVGQGGQEAGRVTQRPEPFQLEVEKTLAQEDHDLRSRQDPDVGRQAEIQGVFPDEPVSEGVKGRDRGVRVAVGHELVDPSLHLRGGLVGEGQGQDLRGPGSSSRDEPGDPPGHDLGLAGARAGHDQQRTVAMGDGANLIGVEPAQQAIESRRRRRRGRAGTVTDFLRPDRDLLEWPGGATATCPDHGARMRR